MSADELAELRDMHAEAEREAERWRFLLVRAAKALGVEAWEYSVDFERKLLEAASRPGRVRAEWLAEATEREARAANPEVVGLIERETELAVVVCLRRCAGALS